MSGALPTTKPWLSTDEAWAALEASHTGIFTTLRRDGVPISLPVWFVVVERRIFASTPRRSRKVARVRHDQRAAFLVESGRDWRELCAVHLTGVAQLVLDEDPRIAVIQDAFDGQYAAFRPDLDRVPAATKDHYEESNVYIEFIPDDRILSWDNSRIPTL